METLLRQIRDLGTTGWLVFGAIQILVSVSGVFPAAVLGIIAGTLYGLPLGFFLAAADTLAGAWLAFMLSRSFFRPAIESFLRRRPRLQDLDRIVARDGWKVVLMLRISPIMPFSVTSYMLGLSSVRPRDYLLGTLASLPALLGYVFIGSLADAGLAAQAAGAHWLYLMLLAAGALAAVALTLRIRQIAAAAAAPRIGDPPASASALDDAANILPGA
jgi:uncharacterized membrane protein YdjX (TVP38/TMEM64 family)